MHNPTERRALRNTIIVLIPSAAARCNGQNHPSRTIATGRAHTHSSAPQTGDETQDLSASSIPVWCKRHAVRSLPVGQTDTLAYRRWAWFRRKTCAGCVVLAGGGGFSFFFFLGAATTFLHRPHSGARNALGLFPIGCHAPPPGMKSIGRR